MEPAPIEPEPAPPDITEREPRPDLSDMLEVGMETEAEETEAEEPTLDEPPEPEEDRAAPSPEPDPFDVWG